MGWEGQREGVSQFRGASEVAVIPSGVSLIRMASILERMEARLRKEAGAGARMAGIDTVADHPSSTTCAQILPYRKRTEIT